MTRIAITVDGIRAVAELNETAAPKAAAKVLAALPFTTKLVHASRSGSAAYAKLPELADPDLGLEAQVSMLHPGLVAYDAEKGLLIFGYGQGQARRPTGAGWFSGLGDIVENARDIYPKFADTREKGVLQVTVERED